MLHKKRCCAIALLLVLAMLLSGCDMLEALLGGEVVRYEEMEYTRPDPQKLEEILEESCRLAAESEDVNEVLESVYAFYDIYDQFVTGNALAQIEYSKDMTDLYWEAEYAFCEENVSAAEAGLDKLYYALADSPLRKELETEFFGDGFFDDYDGESIWDETFMAMMEQQAQLESRYYALSAEALETEYYSEEYFSQYGIQMEELYVELVALRQQIAAYAGFDSYPEYAYAVYHSRDYTPQQTEVYFRSVSDALADSYRAVNASTVWETAYTECSQTETFAYVKSAASTMGGHVWQAFRTLEQGNLYDIGNGPNKYDGAFETYLWSYQEPYIFVCPTMTQGDKLSFAHEFGHFVNDHLCYGSYVGTDVAEVQSQGMEYLSLCYTEDAPALTAYKMADSLCVYVEQSAFALFEQQVYGLTGDDLTVENVRALYGQIGSDFGFDSWGWDVRDYVTVSHFFTSPMYIASYVVSNDVAMQMYQLEKAQAGKGLEAYERCLESEDTYLVEFAEACGLKSPFARERMETVKATFQEELAAYL